MTRKPEWPLRRERIATDKRVITMKAHSNNEDRVVLRERIRPLLELGANLGASSAERAVFMCLHIF
jgi:hypothetical protein